MFFINEQTHKQNILKEKYMLIAVFNTNYI